MLLELIIEYYLHHSYNFIGKIADMIIVKLFRHQMQYSSLLNDSFL